MSYSFNNTTDAEPELTDTWDEEVEKMQSLTNLFTDATDVT